MKEELEEGHFDKDGMYIFDKTKVEKFLRNNLFEILIVFWMITLFLSSLKARKYRSQLKHVFCSIYVSPNSCKL